MSIPSHCDIVVIGGGPGGALASALLAQRGYHVVLFEKRRYPRYQVGESLIPHFWKYCKLVGVDERIREEHFIRKAGGTVVWGGVIRQTAFSHFGYREPALHVERDRFDQILLEHARSLGVAAFEEVTVTGVDLSAGNGATVRYAAAGEAAAGMATARYVVDASGQSAVIARALGTRVIDEGFRFMSVWGYFEGSRYVGLDGRAHPFEHLRETPPTTFVTEIADTGGWGWVWHIPLRDNTSVGLVVPLDALKSLNAKKDDLEVYFLRMCAQIPNLNRLLESARFCKGSVRAIRDYSYLPTQLTGPNYFLVGDAAAFTDPIFSVGIVMAMYSAYLAAWAIDASLRRPETQERNHRLFESQVRDRIEVSRALALPRYAADVSTPERIRQTIQFESQTERQLMRVVSAMTTRSHNYTAMMPATESIDGDPKMWQIEQIMF